MTRGTRIMTAVGLAGAAWLAAAGCDTGTSTQQAEAIDTLALGERLTYTTGCQDCHTPGTFYGEPDFSRQLSGSDIGWGGAWGVSFARNLTPAVQGGIADWTDEQVAVAIRSGMRPDGSMLLPPMPWPNFSKLTDLEVTAIVRFLRSVPSVEHQVPAVVPPGATAPTGTAVLFVPPPPAWDAPPAPAE